MPHHPTQAQSGASRRNGVKSHGPVTAEGQERSCLNRFQHGFRGVFCVVPTENQAEFDALLDGLREEHQPATPTESLLVDKMAQHFWLSRRAETLQVQVLRHSPPDAPKDDFALYLRYQTANDRGFSKCLHDLLKLRAERRKVEKQAAQELRGEIENRRNEELHAARVRTANARAEAQELENSLRQSSHARLPKVRPNPVPPAEAPLPSSNESTNNRNTRHPEDPSHIL